MNIQQSKQYMYQKNKQLQRIVHGFCSEPGKPVLISPKQYKKGIIIIAIVVALLIAEIVVCVYEYVEVQNLHGKEILHEQQLQLMQDKTNSIQDKMNKLDSLDQELRQMVKGSEPGDTHNSDNEDSSDNSKTQ